MHSKTQRFSKVQIPCAAPPATLAVRPVLPYSSKAPVDPDSLQVSQNVRSADRSCRCSAGSVALAWVQWGCDCDFSDPTGEAAVDGSLDADVSPGVTRSPNSTNGKTHGLTDHQSYVFGGPSTFFWCLVFWLQNPVCSKLVITCFLMGELPTKSQFLLAMGVHWLMIGTCMTLGYHRYASHHAYRIGRIGKFVLIALTQLGWQGGALWWAAKHRRHHKHCDQPLDPHSWAQTSFLYALFGWVVMETETEREFLPGHLDHPELWLLNTFHAVPGLCMAAVMNYYLGWDAMMWGYLVPASSSAIQTFHFNVEFHPPESTKPCKSRNELGDKLASWLVRDQYAPEPRIQMPGGS